VEVLEPDDLRKEFRQIVDEMADTYS